MFPTPLSFSGRPLTIYLARLEQELRTTRDVLFYLVFTPACLAISTSTPCEPHSVGETCVLKADGPSFTPDGGRIYWSLGKRITGDINPSLPESAHEILQAVNYECDNFQKLAIEDSLPVASVNIYCPPCACAIRTALTVCAQESSALIKYTTRIDERLPSSCCSYSTIVKTLTSVLRIMQLTESGQLGPQGDILSLQLLQHLDRVWIEKMLYRLESKPPHPRERHDITRRIGQLVSEASAGEYYAVFIGETEYMRPVLGMSAFPRLPRPPRENEIYKALKKHEYDPWEVKYLGTFTPKGYRNLHSSSINAIPGRGSTGGARTERSDRTDLDVL